MFIVTLSHREMTLTGEECSLAPEKFSHFLGMQREGRVEKAGCVQMAVLVVIPCIGS